MKADTPASRAGNRAPCPSAAMLVHCISVRLRLQILVFAILPIYNLLHAYVTILYRHRRLYRQCGYRYTEDRISEANRRRCLTGS